MSSKVTTLVSNRGGCGKSSLASQLAPAIALAHPNQDVVLFDMSIQGDASTFLLGGVSEPKDAVAGIRTRGGELISSLPPTKGAVAFVNAAFQFSSAAAAPAPRTSFWRGAYAAPSTPTLASSLDWKAHAVRPVDIHPAGGCPANLYVVHGGKGLYNIPFDGLAQALRTAFVSMNSIILIDTDAELSERASSLAAIAASDALAIVLSSSWTDYQRIVDDPANSLFNGLRFLQESLPLLRPRVAHVIFNNVQKRLGAPSGLEAAPGIFPFTPPSTSVESMAEIGAHLRSVASDPGAGLSNFFMNQEALRTNGEFLRAYITALPTIAESAWQQAALLGQPIVCATNASEVQVQAAGHLRAVAARF